MGSKQGQRDYSLYDPIMFIVMRNFENLLAKRIKNFCFIERYKEHNIKSTNSYRNYDTRIPKYFHNRPKGVMEHIMKRNAIEVENFPIDTKAI